MKPPAPGWKAVASGVLADFGGTLVTGTALSILAALVAGTAVEPGGELAAAQAVLDSDLWMAGTMLAGSACTVFGGYVAARVADRDEYAFGVTTGIAVLVIGELLSVGADTGTPLAMRLIGWVITLPLALLGARIRVRQKERKTAGPSA